MKYDEIVAYLRKNYKFVEKRFDNRILVECGYIKFMQAKSSGWSRSKVDIIIFQGYINDDGYGRLVLTRKLRFAGTKKQRTKEHIFEMVDAKITEISGAIKTTYNHADRKKEIEKNRLKTVMKYLASTGCETLKERFGWYEAYYTTKDKQDVVIKFGVIFVPDGAAIEQVSIKHIEFPGITLCNKDYIRGIIKAL